MSAALPALAKFKPNPNWARLPLFNRKGQVLYGSRRTYLKKVVVAEWDGVTADTSDLRRSLAGGF